MQKAILLTLCSTLFLIPLFAKAELTLYGQANISLEEYAKAWKTQSNESFIGIKGFYPIKHKLNAIYRYDLGLNLTDNQGDSTSNSSADEYVSALNNYIGLQGRYGRIVAGTLDTPLKQIKEPFILFKNIRLGDIHDVSSSGDGRVDNMLEYTTPTIDGISFKYMALPEAGDQSSNSLTAASSTALIYETKNTFVAYAKDQDVNGVGTNTNRYIISLITPSYSLGYLKENTRANGNADIETTGYSFSYTSGNTKYKLQQIANTNATTNAIGFDYKLGSNAVLGFYNIDKKQQGVTDKKNTGINLVINFE